MQINVFKNKLIKSKLQNRIHYKMLIHERIYIIQKHNITIFKSETHRNYFSRKIIFLYLTLSNIIRTALRFQQNCNATAYMFHLNPIISSYDISLLKLSNRQNISSPCTCNSLRSVAKESAKHFA